MRRLISILLALGFGLGPVAFAIGYDENGSLPACCRRHGAHHCAMDATQSAPQRTSAFTAPSHCPLFPGHQSATPSSISALLERPFSVALAVQPAQIRTLAMSAKGAGNLCTYTLRGPPAALISA